MHLSTFFSLVQLCLAPMLARAELDKPAAWENLDFISARLNSLPKTNARISPWTSGNIPQACYKYTKEKSRDPKQFRAFTVHMDDCDVGPWVICRELGTTTTIEATVNALARLPVGVRQWVGTLTVFKEGIGGSAPGYDVILAGANAGNTATMLHEAMHIVDWTGALGEFMHAQGDKNKDWVEAYNKDSHVADNYARNNHVENFAQYAGLVLYDRVTNQGLQSTYPVRYNSVMNQIRKQGARANASNRMFALTNTGMNCTRRWPLSPAVNPVNGNPVEKRSDVVDPATQALLDMVEGLETPNCTLSTSL